MIKVMKTILVLFLLSIVPVSARIGEDVAQLRARYGKETSAKPDGKGSGVLTFRKNKLLIEATLENGKTVSLKFNPAPGGTADDLNYQTALDLIELNCGPKKMEMVNDLSEKGVFVWQDDPPTRRAIYFDLIGSLMISIMRENPVKAPLINPEIDGF